MTRKRGRGEGTIWERADGEWMGQISLGQTQSGKRRRATVRGKSKEEVLAALARLRTKFSTGQLPESNQVTVGDYLDSWLKVSARPSVSSSTYECYELCCKRVKSHIGNTRLQKLMPHDIACMLTQLHDADELSDRTRQLTLTVFSKAIQQAVTFGMLSTNPCSKVTRPKVSTKEYRTWSETEFGRFLILAATKRMGAFWRMAILTGARSGELIGLQWQDVSLNSKTITIRRTMSRDREAQHKRIFKEPKTKKARRTITLPDAAVEILQSQRVQQMAAGLAATEYVFCQSDGTPLRPCTPGNSFRHFLKTAGLPKIRLHDLRHSHATLLLSLGEHPKVVQERLGHATIGVTMDVYSHVLPSMQASAAGKLNGLVSQPLAALSAAQKVS